MVQSILSWYIGQCELRSLKYGAKRPQLIHCKGELRSLNMAENVISWYIGQCELRNVKYGSKRPHVVHWAM